jgi:hypothetical protein
VSKNPGRITSTSKLRRKMKKKEGKKERKGERGALRHPPVQM